MKIENWKTDVISSNDYIKEAVKTESRDFDIIKTRLFFRDNHSIIRLLHASLGMTTEVGEFVDSLKKHIFYGKRLSDLDTNMFEELGDLFWYIAIALDVLGYNWEDVMMGNIQKLRKRYTEKFNESEAIKRDIKEEITAIEKVIKKHDMI